jgi:predicted RNA methylase
MPERPACQIPESSLRTHGSDSDRSKEEYRRARPLTHGSIRTDRGDPVIPKATSRGRIRPQRLTRKIPNLANREASEEVGGAIAPDRAPLATGKEADSRDLYDVLADKVVYENPPANKKPNFIVDLFSGCGGMSLGFDLYQEGSFFQTVLALDIDEAMVRAFNRNETCRTPSGKSICRLADLSQFLNEAEVLAFYLDHLNECGFGSDLSSLLADLPLMSLRAFKGEMGALDRGFLSRLSSIRNSLAYKRAYSKLTPHAAGQTSVVGFHHSLCLPMTSATRPVLTSLIWGGNGAINEERNGWIPDGHAGASESRLPRKLKQEWDEEVGKLRAKAKGSAKGQLASSARRVAAASTERTFAWTEST